MATQLDYRFLKVAETNPGLENDGNNAVKVKVKAAGGLTLDSDGLSIDGSQINELQIEEHVISGADMTSKSFTLNETMADTDQVALVVYGGVPLNYGVDYTATSSTVLGWNGLGLDGQIAEGNEVQVTYPI